jgi:nicotinamide mononucleotide transporter
MCSALYIVVFFQSKFYADMTLQFYYLGVSIYGWFSWKEKAKQTGKELPIKKTNLRNVLILLPITIIVLFLYYYVLKNHTDSPLPFADSFTTALSITATWMLAKKMIEHWILWIIVDSVSAGLYFYKELYPTTVLFVIYTIMAVIGWIQWRKDLKLQTN